jgi:prepilin-type N-terminal cleavage/methylation domain-containing protein
VRRGARAQGGFTLIELMVSLVLFSLVIAGMMSVAITIPRGYHEQQMTVSAEGAARASMDYLASALRGASPGAPTQDIQHVNTCATGAIMVEDNVGPGGSDRITLVYASGSVITTLRTDYNGGNVITVANASQLAPGDTLLITNLDQAHVVQIPNVIGAVNTGTGQVTLNAATCASLALPAGGYPIGSLAIRAQRATFEIRNDASTDNIPTLMMDPDAEGPALAEPFAEGIEDLQIAVGVDADASGDLAELGTSPGDDEWGYNALNETVAPAGSIRAVRLSLVAMTGAFTGIPAFQRPRLENHDVGPVDEFRRRVLTTIIDIRNVGGSP